MCILEFLVVLGCELDSCNIKKLDKKNERKERALLFPPSSTIGVSIFVIPSEFISVKFETSRLVCH